MVPQHVVRSGHVGQVVVGAVVVLLLAVASASASPNRTVGWGANFRGQLGNGNTTNADVPVPAGELLGMSAIAAGGDDSAVLVGDTVEDWGDNQGGQLGNGTVSEDSINPVLVAGLSGVTRLDVGGTDPALVGSEVVSWDASGPAPVGVEGATAISGGPGGFVLALMGDGTVKAWGRNDYGQLGAGTTSSGTEPQGPFTVCAVGTEGACPEGPFLTGVVGIAAGESHALALLEDGTVVAWGYDQFGQLGNGIASPFSKFPTPDPVGGVSGITGVAAAGSHSMALKNDGTVVEWGGCCDGKGALPAQLPELAGVTAIAAGGGHSLALLGNGTVKAWGTNWAGQLGDGNHKNTSTPTLVKGLSGIVGIAAGEYHSLAFGPEPPPTVKKLSVKTGPGTGGTPVTITGTEFTGATAVTFGATSASFTVNSATSISATSPEHANGSVNITVTTPGGTSAVTSADRFKYTPTVTGVSPGTGPATGGATVTVTGTGFAIGATAFKFGTTGASSKTVKCASSTTCTVTAPPHAAGAVDVRATVNATVSPVNPPGDRYTYE